MPLNCALYNVKMVGFILYVFSYKFFKSAIRPLENILGHLRNVFLQTSLYYIFLNKFEITLWIIPSALLFPIVAWIPFPLARAVDLVHA